MRPGCGSFDRGHDGCVRLVRDEEEEKEGKDGEGGTEVHSEGDACGNGKGLEAGDAG